MNYTITFYYVEGINECDTPYFQTLQFQDDYFESKVVTRVESSYYPPFYHNTIKFTSEDLNFKSHVNYLSITGDRKTYYYFIDSFRYLSDSMIEIDITMDTIQTYMFDIEFSHAVIERKFIERWYNNETINRKYIRENQSHSSISKLKSRAVLNNDTTKWYCVSRYTDYPSTFDQSYLGSVEIKYAGQSVPGAKEYPMQGPCMVSTIEPATLRSGNTDYFMSLAKSTENNDSPKCLRYFVLPFEVLQGIEYSNVIDITNSVNYRVYKGDGTSFVTGWITSKTANYTTKLNVSIKGFEGFSRQTEKGVPFKSAYVPAMLDENYIWYTFGDSEARSEYPLHELSVPHVYNLYWGSIDTGDRYYMINTEASLVDTYNTLAINSNTLYLELINDPWKEYLSQNIATGLTTLALTGVSFGYAGALGGAVTDTMKTQVLSPRKSKDEKVSYLKAKKAPKQTAVRATKRLAEGKYIDDTGQTISTTSSSSSTPRFGIQNVQSLVDYSTNAVNKMWAPVSLEKNNGFGGVVNTNKCLVYSEEWRCDDFESVAQFYHRNGYLVNEYVSGKNLFDYVQNRYYYNVLKCSDVDVHINNTIESQELVDEIEGRLINGLRLWRVGPIGDFQYDNVELDIVGA